MNNYDVIVIGAGMGGYTAAIRVSQLGGKVLLVEKDSVGGVCLNAGCIPTKALIACTSLYDQIKISSRMGIKADNLSINLKEIIDRKNFIVNKIVKGVEFLLKKNNIHYIKGEAKLIGSDEIEIIENSGGKIHAKGKKIILAMGSSPKLLKNIKIDGEKFVTSDHLLSLAGEVPKRLNIIGAGVIGIHFAEIFNSLGCDVTVFEALPEILPGFDDEIIKSIRSILSKKKIKFKTNTQFDLSQAVEKNLISIGRTPNTGGLDIRVNEKMETSLPGVYAVGDITGIKMLAHAASAQGITAAENAMGIPRTINYNAIPATIYTHPEIGVVGLTEEEAKKQFKIKIGKFPFAALGYANAIGEINGFIKIIINSENKNILGVHIIGPQASTLIGIASLSMSNNFTVDQFVNVIHAHPTLSEGMFEAGLNALDRSINI